MRVADVMTRGVRSLSVDATLNEVLAAMWSGDVGALPIVDDHGLVVGMVTDRDAAMATFLQARLPAQIPVREVMSRQVWACQPEDPVSTAEEVMRTRQVRRLPVTDRHGALVGIVTLSDVARAAASGRWVVPAGHLARTLSAVAGPRPGAEEVEPTSPTEKFVGG